jgi:hypothetical protein
MKKFVATAVGSILVIMLSGCSSDPTMNTELSQVTIENSLLVPTDLPDMNLEATYFAGRKIPPLSDSFDPENFEDVDFRKCTDVYSPVYLSPNYIPTAETWAWTVLYDQSKDVQSLLVAEFLRIADPRYGKIVEEVATNQSVCQDFTIGGELVTVSPLEIGKFGDFTLAYNLSPKYEDYAESEPNFTVVVLGYGTNYLTALLDLNKEFSVSKVASIAEAMDSKFKKMAALQK